jgi:hypothetical protein
MKLVAPKKWGRALSPDPITACQPERLDASLKGWRYGVRR